MADDSTDARSQKCGPCRRRSWTDLGARCSIDGSVEYLAIPPADAALRRARGAAAGACDLSIGKLLRPPNRLPGLRVVLP